MSEIATISLDEQKKRLRVEARRRRTEAARRGGEAGAARAAEALRDRVLAAIVVPERSVVSAYWPMRDELDPRPLMGEMHRRGHRICLPVVTGKDRPLIFRAWRPDDALVPAAFGTQVPPADRPQRRPRVLLVPLLAFDRAGYRLGYGGGFYDRTLKALRADGAALAVGLAYAGQEVPAVPHDGDDQRLDWIVTEAEAIDIA